MLALFARLPCNVLLAFGAVIVGVLYLALAAIATPHNRLQLQLGKWLALRPPLPTNSASGCPLLRRRLSALLGANSVMQRHQRHQRNSRVATIVEGVEGASSPTGQSTTAAHAPASEGPVWCGRGEEVEFSEVEMQLWSEAVDAVSSGLLVNDLLPSVGSGLAGRRATMTARTASHRATTPEGSGGDAAQSAAAPPLGMAAATDEEAGVVGCAASARFDALELLEPLGHGGFGTVYAARLPGEDERFAVKVSRPRRQRARETLRETAPGGPGGEPAPRRQWPLLPVPLRLLWRRRDAHGGAGGAGGRGNEVANRPQQQVANLLEEEGSLLATIQHKHILSAYGVAMVHLPTASAVAHGAPSSSSASATASIPVPAVQPGIVMALAAGGSVDHLLFGKGRRGAAERPTPTLQMRARLAYELGLAVTYLHSVSLLHCDLKLSNVLLTDGDHPRVQLSDFGMAMQLELHQQTFGVRGSPRYMAPEVAFRAFGFPADVYSYGICLYELLHARRFLAELTDARSVLLAVFNGHRPPSSLPDDELAALDVADRRFADAAAVVATQCWEHDWELRPSMADVTMRILLRRVALGSDVEWCALRRYAEDAPAPRPASTCGANVPP